MEIMIVFLVLYAYIFLRFDCIKYYSVVVVPTRTDMFSVVQRNVCWDGVLWEWGGLHAKGSKGKVRRSSSGAYTGFFKGGCGRTAPEKFFSHPGAKPVRTHLFAPTPLFAFLLFWTNFKIFFSHPGAKLLRTHPFLHPLPGGKLLLLALLRG